MAGCGGAGGRDGESPLHLRCLSGQSSAQSSHNMMVLHKRKTRGYGGTW